MQEPVTERWRFWSSKRSVKTIDAVYSALHLMNNDSVIKEITMCEQMGDMGREKSIGLCVAQQETYSKGHRLLTACTLVGLCVCACLWSLLQQKLCTHLLITNRGGKLRVAVQTERLISFKISSMFTMMCNFFFFFFVLSFHPQESGLFHSQTLSFWWMVSKVNTSKI